MHIGTARHGTARHGMAWHGTAQHALHRTSTHLEDVGGIVGTGDGLAVGTMVGKRVLKPV